MAAAEPSKRSGVPVEGCEKGSNHPPQGLNLEAWPVCALCFAFWASHPREGEKT